MIDQRYRYFEIMHPSADAFKAALAEALAEVVDNGGEVASVSMAVPPMPNATGPESRDLVRIAQILVKEAHPGELGAW